VTEVVAHLRPLDGPRDMDLDAAQRAAGDLLDALGVDLTIESVRDTPRRMARITRSC
jgi:GTP cyclohydrolase I